MKRKVETLVVNLFGGPGSGKSTLAAGVFAYLKNRGVNCEMALEFAKEKVWEESFNVLGNQIYVFGKQHHTLHRLLGKVDVVITDSPLLLSLHYGKNECEAFRELVLHETRQMTRLNILVQRVKPYNPEGRTQKDEGEAKAIDEELVTIHNNTGEVFNAFPGDESSIAQLGDIILKLIQEEHVPKGSMLVCWGMGAS